MTDILLTALALDKIKDGPFDGLPVTFGFEDSAM